MGQARLAGSDAALRLETLVPVDVAGLGSGRQRYALFTDPEGGILDDPWWPIPATACSSW
jgi:aminomethyltransferase